jgi:hypothetical protein
MRSSSAGKPGARGLLPSLSPITCPHRGEAHLVVNTDSAAAENTEVWTEYETALSQVLLESRAGCAPRGATYLLCSSANRFDRQFLR